MPNYIVQGSDLTSIANAIRTKGSTSEQLAFPTGFVSAIEALPSGGSMPIDWADVTEVTVGANSVSNTQGVADFFSTYAPYSLIVLTSALTANNQIVNVLNSSATGGNTVQRWKNGVIAGTTVGAGFDGVIPQGSKYLVFVKK